MQRLACQAQPVSVAFLPAFIDSNCIGSVRFLSRHARRRPRADRREGRVDRNRKDHGRHNGHRGHGVRQSRLVYYVIPEPPPPPKFDFKTLGMAWTKPSRRVSESPAAEEFFTSGTISTNHLPQPKPSDIGAEKPAADSTVSSITNLIDKIQAGNDLMKSTNETTIAEQETADMALNLTKIHQSDIPQEEESVGKEVSTEEDRAEQQSRSPACTNDNIQPTDDAKAPWWIPIRPTQQYTHNHSKVMPNEPQLAPSTHESNGNMASNNAPETSVTAEIQHAKIQTADGSRPSISQDTFSEQVLVKKPPRIT